MKELRSIFEKNKIYSKLEILNEKILQANFWQDKINSKNTTKEKKLYEDLINSYNNSIKKLKDLNDLIQLALEENNQVVKK
ncbi:MAG: peptide chain release factor 2, partial [Candidatus Pelagibacter sp.]